MGAPTEPRRTFDGVAAIYDSVRPGYPREMFDDLFALLPPAPRIVEVGPGTGQATRDLLARGAQVHAIEIGPAMADRLRANIPADALRITVGDFEQVDVEPGRADAVFAATAYHWVTPPHHVDRPATFLDSGGVVAIVDLVQVDSPTDQGFFAAAQPIYARYGEGHTGPPAPARDAVDPPMRAALDDDERFGHVELRQYDWDQTYTAAEYRRLMTSYSSTQMLDAATRRGLLDDMETLIVDRFDDAVTRPLVVALTTAVRR